ncbi:MAG: hypothetical protein IH921_07175 [Gemmatimonadetes bacterium]|nr:hypothetical protein [Gemmatimonadota bacterium]
MGVLDDVDGVVEWNEGVVGQWVVDERDGQHQQHCQQETLAGTSQGRSLRQLHSAGEDTPWLDRFKRLDRVRQPWPDAVRLA